MSDQEATLTRRHLLVLLTCCGMVASSVGLCVNSYGVFYTALCRHLGVGRAAVTFHATLAGIITGLLSPVMVGLMQRSARPVPIRLLTAAGAALTSLSFLVVAASNSLWMLNLSGVMRGVGNSCFYLATITLVLGNWFKRNQGAIVGGVLAFSGVAGAVLSPVLSAIIRAWGFGAAAVFAAAFIALASLPGCLFCLELRPEDAALAPYGRAAAKAASTRPVNRFTAKSPVFYLLGLMIFFCCFTSGLNSHLPGFSESIGAGSAVGAAMISASMTGNILSKLLSGALGDRIGVYRAFGLMFVLVIVGVVGLLLLPPVTLCLMGGAFLFGCIYSPAAVGISGIIRQVYGDGQYGRAYSILAIPSTVAPALAMLFNGALYDLTGSYLAVLLCCLASAALALLFWVLAACTASRYNTMQG